MKENVRNIAIIAHVDHGKTTLVDQLLRQSGTLKERNQTENRILDSNDLERERGITILSKNTAIKWNNLRINIVDTPGHADFGGEVERVLSMVDSVLLLVDAVEGPMPQTRFVTQKAFALGLKPIVVINKIDRPGARPDWVLEQTFDLFDQLGASDDQLDFITVYTSAIHGYASLHADERDGNFEPLFNIIASHVPAPDVDELGHFQMRVSSLGYTSFTGVIGIGRIQRGSVKTGAQIVVIDREQRQRKARISQIFDFLGLERILTDSAEAGDIVALSGIDKLSISDTLCAPEQIESLPALSVDEPTVSMTFQVNKSPFAGDDGKFITSRKIRERLQTELIHNVALRVEDTDDPDRFKVSGRGELHLAILIENMRREGFELGVSRPEVIYREIDGVLCEPYEQLTIDVETCHQGDVMQRLGERKGEVKNIVSGTDDRVRIDYLMPARGLIGFRTEFLTLTSGTGLLYHVFDSYAAAKSGQIGQRTNGVLISNVNGKSLAYAMFALQDRGRLFITRSQNVYEGMLVGIHKRPNDLVVNPTRAKQLTNIRAAGTDENLLLSPPIKYSLEQALEFIDDDELVEVTPNHIRLRKRYLKEHERKKIKRTINADAKES